jgi:hypothetical protein
MAIPKDSVSGPFELVSDGERARAMIGAAVPKAGAQLPEVTVVSGAQQVQQVNDLYAQLDGETLKKDPKIVKVSTADDVGGQTLQLGG